MNKHAYKKKTAILFVIGISSVAAMSGIVSSEAEETTDSEALDPPQSPDDVELNEQVIDVEGPIAAAAIEKKTKVHLAARNSEKRSRKTAAKEILHPLDDLSHYETVAVLATGYTAGVESTGKTQSHPSYGITKSGIPVHRGIYSTIAADPEVFPIGSILYIPDYGYGVVADTGSAIKGDRIDLYFETVNDVYDNWGKRNVEVYVVKKGDGQLTRKQFELYNATARENGLALP